MELHLFNMESPSFIRELRFLSLRTKDGISQTKSTPLSKSYTDGVMAVCISHALPIGIDIEKMRRRSPETMMHFIHTFTTFEIKDTPLHLNEEWFYRAWTAMESYFKLMGGGFSTKKNFVLDLERKSIYQEGKKVAWLEHFVVKDLMICLCSNQVFSKDNLRITTHGLRP